MQIILQLPDPLEPVLRRNIEGDMEAYSREALAVQLYRERKLTHGQLQEFLGVSSYAADAVLKKHGGVDEWTPEELAAQVRASRQIRNPSLQ